MELDDGFRHDVGKGVADGFDGMGHTVLLEREGVPGASRRLRDAFPAFWRKDEPPKTFEEGPRPRRRRARFGESAVPPYFGTGRSDPALETL